MALMDDVSSKDLVLSRLGLKKSVGKAKFLNIHVELPRRNGWRINNESEACGMSAEWSRFALILRTQDFSQ